MPVAPVVEPRVSEQLFRGDGPDALANAVVALLQFARASNSDFTFGPLRLADLERDGLLLEGDIGAAVTMLAAVAGIAAVEQ